MTLFAELKRRNVFRVVAAYVVLSWLLLQIGDVVFDFMDVPDWAGRLLIAMLAIGFVPAVVFSWAYEITPEGVKKESEVDRTQSITGQTGKKLDYITIGMVVLALTVFVGDRFLIERQEPPQATASGADQPASTADSTDTSDHSIAVLPFVALSEAKEDEFFADGLSEELLNVLAKVDALKVAGRTSSFHFKGKNEDLRAIGEKLGVANILEGSVRRQDDRVRITAQLIKVDDGFHLWSETYDRTLDDIFAIQDDIAQSVVIALKITLLGEAPQVIASQRNVSAENHARYLSARARQNLRTVADLRAARDLFESITVAAPDFELGWAGLATSTLLLLSNHQDLPADAAFSIADQAIQRALSLNDSSAEAWSAKGYFHLEQRRTGFQGEALEQARAALERSIELNPKFTQSLYWLAIAHETAGRLDLAADYYDRALAIDPLARVPAARRPTTLARIGDFERAESAARYLVSALPDFSLAYWNLADWARSRGALDEVLAYQEKAADLDPSDGRVMMSVANTRYAMGDLAGARRNAARITAPDVWVYEARMFQLILDGDFPGYLQAAEEAVKSGFDTTRNLALAQIQWGDAAVGLEMLRAENPGLFQTPPLGAADNLYLTAHVVHALRKQDQPETAARIAASALAASDASEPPPYDIGWRVARLIVVAANGEVEAALEELQEAWDLGLRFSAVGAYPTIREDACFSEVMADPRFAALVEQMESDLAAALERVDRGETQILTP